jgi:hypothetical protein
MHLRAVDSTCAVSLAGDHAVVEARPVVRCDCWTFSKQSVACVHTSKMNAHTARCAPVFADMLCLSFVCLRVTVCRTISRTDVAACCVHECVTFLPAEWQQWLCPRVCKFVHPCVVAKAHTSGFRSVCCCSCTVRATALTRIQFLALWPLPY